MATSQIEGKDLYYEIAGAGKPLVLIHSAAMSVRVWDGQFEAFAKHFQTIRLDLYGYGRSPFTDEKRIDHAGDVAALLDHLGIQKAAVLGMSMGSEVAMAFALRYPQRTSALILVGAGLDGYDYPEEAFAWWGDFVGALAASEIERGQAVFIQNALNSTVTPLDDSVKGRIRELMADYTWQHYEDGSLLWKGMDPPPITRLGEVTCPTLVITGEGDTSVTHAIAKTLVEGMPDATSVVIPGAAHLANLQQPERFNEAVIGFLRNLTPDPSP